jgi:TIR domain-containing protein
VPLESDYGSPFFLSYARARENSSGDPDGYVRRFFYDLSGNVAALTSLPADLPVGFMDQNNMGGGMWWTPELMRAVGTCQVLVALLSASYLKSSWCRMEWHAFSKRVVREREGCTASPNQGCIIPVLWAPLPVALPEHISPVTIFKPDHEPSRRVPQQYGENGIFGLMRMRAPKNSYEIVTWQLAKLIARLYHSQLAVAREFDSAELRGCLSG